MRNVYKQPAGIEEESLIILEPDQIDVLIVWLAEARDEVRANRAGTVARG